MFLKYPDLGHASGIGMRIMMMRIIWGRTAERRVYEH